MAATIESLRPEDASAVLRLLEVNHLPTDGLSDHWQTTDGSLLRSVAVDPNMQGHELGHELVSAAIRPRVFEKPKRPPRAH
jgi:hypothetical protein